MHTPVTILRAARSSELVFAVIALYLAASVPLRPLDHRGLWLLAHWYGMTLVAFGLVIALRRPSRAAWAVATILSAYFVVNCAIGVAALRRGGAAAEYAGSAVLVSYVILGIALLAQLHVAISCWRSRSIWRRVTQGDIVAPVA
jgi:hypothetical protein